MCRAIRSLPTPLSPVMRTLASDAPALAASRTTSLIAWLAVTIRPGLNDGELSTLSGLGAHVPAFIEVTAFMEATETEGRPFSDMLSERL